MPLIMWTILKIGPDITQLLNLKIVIISIHFE
ncbi:hypothetical protein ACVWV0_004565 [Ewingella americana]